MRAHQLQVRSREGVRQLEYRTHNGKHERLGPAIPSGLTGSLLRDLLARLREEVPPGTPDRRRLILEHWCAMLEEVQP